MLIKNGENPLLFVITSERADLGHRRNLIT